MARRSILVRFWLKHQLLVTVAWFVVIPLGSLLVIYSATNVARLTTQTALKKPRPQLLRSQKSLGQDVQTNVNKSNLLELSVLSFIGRSLQTPPLSEAEVSLMDLTFLSTEKIWPYGTDAKGLETFKHLRPSSNDKIEIQNLLVKASKFYNSLATFPSLDDMTSVIESPNVPSQFKSFATNFQKEKLIFKLKSSHRDHGLLGLGEDGKLSWRALESPPSIGEVNSTKVLSDGGGFYLELSDSLPLDRDPPDVRHPNCKSIKYNLFELPDASVIITFYNEPPSTLLRTIHSVLNRTPAPILREIILVDDHSNTKFATNELAKYITLLPKVKLMRLPQRLGIVHGRLAGARVAGGRAIVVLDSHVEVSDGWLEPQLQRLMESPESIVFPQIDSINSETFEFTTASGIGCWLKFKWSMQERPTITNTLSKTVAIPSPSMAGGLFAMRRDWFFELGGYDEQFTMWGAENVEMAFRAWMCGGRVECAPCSHVFHIYRKGGSGYKSVEGSLWKNRFRTARAWLGDALPLAFGFLGSRSDENVGSFDEVLDVKKRLGCDRRNISWFMDTLIPVGGGVRSMDDVLTLSEVRNGGVPNLCLDTMGGKEAGNKMGLFWCHETMGTQGWLLTKSGVLRSVAHERYCMTNTLEFVDCYKADKNAKSARWFYEADKRLRWCEEPEGNRSCLCLGLERKDSENTLILGVCNQHEPKQIWKVAPWEPKKFPPLEYSQERSDRMQRINDRLDGKEKNYSYYLDGMAPNDD